MIKRTLEVECDYCGKPVNETETYVLSYGGLGGYSIMANNTFPHDGFHYHYRCMSWIIKTIRKENSAKEKLQS